MDDLLVTRALLSEQMAEAVAADPIGALPIIAALQKETGEHLREAVRHAALSSSWREIADNLGVSKQAAHQRFKAYADGVTDDIKSERRTMKRAKRSGDAVRAAEARARRDQLVGGLRCAAKELQAEA